MHLKPIQLQKPQYLTKDHTKRPSIHEKIVLKIKIHLGRRQMNFCHIIVSFLLHKYNIKKSISLHCIHLSAYTRTVSSKTRDGMQEQKEEYKL